MKYREAECLRTLLAEVNTAAPHRSTQYDGWIGDAAHATRVSDHNPWVLDVKGVGVVRARDVTHDPAGGVDGNRLASEVAGLLRSHPALGAGAYVIWDGRIISSSRFREGWRRYTGANPHKSHVHVSVGVRGYDSTTRWGVLEREDDDMAVWEHRFPAWGPDANPPGDMPMDQQLQQARGFAADAWRRTARIEAAVTALARSLARGLDLSEEAVRDVEEAVRAAMDDADNEGEG